MITLNGRPINVTLFPDKTSQVWKLPEDDLRQFASTVVWRFENEGEFMHLAQLADLLTAQGAVFELHLPYLPYARQDKEISNDQTFALRTFADLIDTLRAKRVVLYDPHNAKPFQAILDAQVEIRTFEKEARAAYDLCAANVWCFPDAGALQRYGRTLCGLGEDRLVASKVRDQATGAITGLSIGESVTGSHQRAMIVDDICDGGATFVALAKLLRENGISEVFLFVSHGIFSRGLEPLFAAGISRIFTPEGEKNP